MSKEKSEIKSQEEPKRVIGLLDLIFLSIGGQSPFLSILTYGVAAFLIAGYFAPIAVVLGTALMLLNGLVSYKLAVRFTKAGGYYTYAYYSLTKRLGFETGWIYLVYSTLYGSAYVLGATFVLSTIFPINPWIIATTILVVSSLLSILGIKPSSAYAAFASVLEILIMAILAIFFLQSTNFKFYNPFDYTIPSGTLALGILFGAGIPTGFGSIAPLSGEVKNPKKNVPLAMIIVVLTGGLLAAFDVYSIGTHLLFFNLMPSNVDLLSLIRDRFGLFTFIFVIFAAINDAVLATLSFLLSTSRTAYAMSLHGFLPGSLMKLEPSRGPINAALFTIGLYALSIILALSFANSNPYIAFEKVGEIAMMSSLIVNISANFSLFKISLKRVRKRIVEISLAIVALGFTLWDLLYSIAYSEAIMVYVFMGLIILGFIAAEVIEMSREEG